MFYVSLLKKKIGKDMTLKPKLLPFELEGTPLPEPVEILNNQEKNVKRKANRELLVRWERQILEDNMWVENNG
jgi:hypothetical protein